MQTQDQKQPRQMKVFSEAYACSDFGDGPTYATFIVTQEFVDSLANMRSIVIDNELSECRKWGSPENWGAGGIEDELRLTSGELVVTRDSMWFRDQPKHADYHIETRAIDIEELLQRYAGSDSEIYMGDDPDELAQHVADDGAEDDED